MGYMGEFLYYLTIKPIWLLFEVIFTAIYRACENPGISILSVSIVMNILVLPMYLKSDSLQEEERKKQKQMEGWVKHIRKTFKGDERFMILSEYYRLNDYQPYYVLKSSLSLLLQVPFFVAAYDFLSHLSLLRGTPFMMIKDLGSPDGLIALGSVHVNLLPILMTAINLTSAAIYTRRGTKKEKIQTVVFALVFLVLLYNSPAGLVFYWTLNNIFSLCKNIVMDFIAGHKKTAPEKEVPDTQSAVRDPATVRIWALSSVLIALFTGFAIPLSVIAASPMDFAQTLTYADPVRYAMLSSALAIGTFVLWGGVVFYLGNAQFRKVLSRILLCISIIAVIDHMAFSGNFGIISVNLDYGSNPHYDIYSKMLSLMFVIQCALILLVLCKKYSKAVINILTILTLCVFIFGIYNLVPVEKTVRTSYLFEDKEKSGNDYGTADINNKILRFSATGKNVVVMMLDRSIGAYIPYILDEKPELASVFSGFTFYPNTVSTGTETVNASAALFGGYEYMMAESNKRDLPLFDKQNESLKLMPSLFGDKGYHMTLINLPTLTEEGFITGKAIFDDMKNCDTYHVQNGEYAPYMTEEEWSCLELEQQKRNFFFYGLFRSAPLITQEKIYDNGDYLSMTCNNIKPHFITSMVFLRLMPELTQVTDSENGELIMMNNDAAHEPTLLNPPDYEPDATVRLFEMNDRTLPDGREMKLSSRDKEGHYDADIATLLKVGKWMDRLKELGVYDNTRIIIVADHGFALDQFQYLKFDEIPLDAESMNPVLLVKDFNAEGDLTTDDTFMTNADVPTIAMRDVIEDPVNPFTNNPVNDDRKYEGPIEVVGGKIHFDLKTQTVFDDKSIPWYSVHDNIFDADNWSLIKEAVK